MQRDRSLKLRQISVLYLGLRNFSVPRNCKSDGVVFWWCCWWVVGIMGWKFWKASLSQIWPGLISVRDEDEDILILYLLSWNWVPNSKQLRSENNEIQLVCEFMKRLRDCRYSIKSCEVNKTKHNIWNLNLFNFNSDLLFGIDVF